MASGDVYRAEVYQNVGSEQTMNVLHFLEVASITDPERGENSVEQIVAEMYLNLAEQLSEDWRVVMLRTQRISPAAGIPATNVLGGAEAIVGAIVSEIVPAQAAILLSLYTDVADRTGRGRLYIPGCPELHQNEGQLTEAAHTALELAVLDWDDVLGPVAGGTGTYRLYVHGPSHLGNADWAVETVVVRSNLATQRRRRAFPGFAS